MSKILPHKILVAQTAFIGDAILATALLETLHDTFPETKIDFLVRKGNEGLFKNHPWLNEVLVWDKTQKKYQNLLKITRYIRQVRYDVLFNLQRFTSSGLVSIFSKAKYTVGFKKNPLSRLFSKNYAHHLDQNMHEIERNHQLTQILGDLILKNPRLYPSEMDFKRVKVYKQTPYICLAPTSVWFTKQFPADRWISFLEQLPPDYQVYLLGAPNDKEACQTILEQSHYSKIKNLAGELSLLESAALMQDAEMNYVNDSAPMHLASAVNAPTCAIFCSTVPSFGFGPLSMTKAVTIETSKNLECRPCGLHGYKTCPQVHFECAKNIEIEQLLKQLP